MQATIVTGHMTVVRGLMYMLAQLFGACFGILLLVRSLRVANPVVCPTA